MHNRHEVKPSNFEHWTIEPWTLNQPPYGFDPWTLNHWSLNFDPAAPPCGFDPWTLNQPPCGLELWTLALLRPIWGLSPAYLAVNSDKEPQRKTTRWEQLPRGRRLAIGCWIFTICHLLTANSQLLTANRTLKLPRRVKGKSLSLLGGGRRTRKRCRSARVPLAVGIGTRKLDV